MEPLFVVELLLRVFTWTPMMCELVVFAPDSDLKSVVQFLDKAAVRI